MSLLEKETRIEVPVQELFDWHKREKAFERLAPPWEKVKVVQKTGDLKEGRVVLAMKQGPLTRRWVAVHRDYIEGKQFVDEQVEGPFAKWVHTHQAIADGPRGSVLKDHIEYQAPLGLLGEWVAGGYIRRKAARTFEFRHGRTRQDLERLHPYASQKPLRIAVTGVSGLVGTALTQFLSGGGHEVFPMVRRKPKAGEKAIYWDPQKSEIDRAALEGLDVVIHLAGESIASGRWNPERKEAIRQSREQGTRFLAEALAKLEHPPKNLLCSSAIGFYGNRGDETLDEASAPGQGFLTETCMAWERACDPARKAGIRVVNVRTGIVLTPLGGALAKMLPPFLMGGGGIIGSGKQWMSWISLEDLVGIFHYIIHEKSLEGPVNATAPQPLTNRDFTKVLGKVLKRPTLFPLPGFMVKLIFGEMGDALLLEGQKVMPQKLQATGFRFLYPELEPALRWELGR